MKAVRFHEHGGPEKLKLDTIPDARPGPGEVLLRVKAASVNHLDIFLRRGLPGVKLPLPHLPGADAAGIVEDLGPGVEGVKVGQRVLVNPSIQCGHCEFCAGGDGSMCLDYAVLGEHRPGTYAEFVAVPARCAVAIPDRMSFEDAASCPLVFLTAWRMLMTRGRLKPGEDVLILGAGAGVGIACIQIAKLCGARVIAAAGEDKKLEKARALGADFLVNYRREEFDKRIREITEKRGVDVVVDYIGKDTWTRSLRSLRRGGRLVTCGATTGHDPVEDLRHIFYRQLEIIGSTMGSEKEFQDVIRCIFQGKLRPVVDRALPLAEAAEAHRLIEGRVPFGKIVLVP